MNTVATTHLREHSRELSVEEHPDPLVLRTHPGEFSPGTLIITTVGMARIPSDDGRGQVDVPNHRAKHLALMLARSPGYKT